MRKLTAIILSVIMLFSAVPLTGFATGEKVIMVDDAEDFAKMTDTRSYILTQNITLGSDFETIPSFGGTLDGNGYTVTVPTNAPIFEVITGTVKNLNLTGTMSLDDGDVSKHYIGVNNIHYAVGVLANRAMGATIDNVHSDVEVTFNKLSDASQEATVVFGGMIGVAYPSYRIDNEKDTIEDVRKTTINNCTVAGKITAEYKELESTHYIESVGGLIALATANVDISNVEVTADITVKNVSGYVAGVLAVQYSTFLPTLDGEYIQVPTPITNVGNVLRNATIKNCLVSGSISRTTDGSGKKISGMVGHAQGLEMSACAYAGTKLEDVKGKERTILSYGNCGNESWCYIKINSCVATLGDKIMIYAYQNTKPFENIITWTSIDNLIVNGSGAKISTIFESSEEAALQTFANNNSDAFSYENGKLILKTVTPPSKDHSHKISVSTEVDGKLSTGMCEDGCNYVTGDPYAGFVQFSSDGKKLRVIMVVSEDELADVANKKLKSLNLTVTIENQRVSIPDERFTVYQSVIAAEKEYVASEGYYIFGAVFSFEVDMSSTNPTVTITYKDANEPVFTGSAKKPNE